MKCKVCGFEWTSDEMNCPYCGNQCNAANEAAKEVMCEAKEDSTAAIVTAKADQTERVSSEADNIPTTEEHKSAAVVPDAMDEKAGTMVKTEDSVLEGKEETFSCSASCADAPVEEAAKAPTSALSANESKTTAVSSDLSNAAAENDFAAVKNGQEEEEPRAENSVHLDETPLPVSDDSVKAVSRKPIGAGLLLLIIFLSIAAGLLLNVGINYLSRSFDPFHIRWLLEPYFDELEQSFESDHWYEDDDFFDEYHWTYEQGQEDGGDFIHAAHPFS